MARISMKKLKEALNKCPEEKLENFYIMHRMSIEDPEADIGMVFFADESHHEAYMKVFDTPAYKVIQEFVAALKEDIKKVAICLIDEDKIEDYGDDTE